MYAIVDIAGQQFRVEKDQQIFVHRLTGNEGDQVGFDQVLLIDNDGKIAVGAPSIQDAAVTCTIIEHLRGDKVIVFKKKRRKGYQKRNGHRQDFTKIQIEAIFEKGGVKAIEAAKKAPAKVKSEAEPKTEAKKAAVAKTGPKKSEATAKKTAAKSESKPAKKAAPKSKTEDKPKAAAKKASPKKK